MSTDNSYTNAKNELLSYEFKEYFESYRETCKKNIEIIKSLSDHSESDSEIAIHHLLTKIYGDMNGISNDIEALFVAIFAMRKRHEIHDKEIQKLRSELQKQGIKVDSLQKYEQDLEWIDKFFKDRSKTSDL